MAVALILFATVCTILAVSFRTGPGVRAFGQALPGFQCPGMQARVHRARYTFSGRTSSASLALTLPPQCMTELRTRLNAGRVMAASRCNVVDPCYKSQNANRWFELEILRERSDPAAPGDYGTDATFRYGDRNL